MECVLGVSLTTTTVRMVLVEGAAADGATVDHDSVDIAVVNDPDELISAIVGTRESAVAGGHRLIATGVAWTDRASAAQLRKALRARGVEDVVFVSELHAAGALAQAVGRAVDYDRTALMFLEGDTAALSVVDTSTGAVVGVQTRRLQPTDVMADLREMIVSLERLAEQPDAIFIVGSGVDAGEAKSQISTVTTLPVHAPDDGDLALARGAALAAAQAPRYEATTVGLAPARDTDDTGALATQLADAGYMSPLGYSQVDDDMDDDFLDGVDDDSEETDSAVDDEDRKPFLLVGSALTSVFVVGVVALVLSLTVSIRPTGEQHPSPNANVTQGTQSAGLASPPPPQPAQAPPVATIQEPIPVVQQAPRTVYVTPPPQAPAPVAAPVPVAPAPVPAAPAPIPEAPAPAVPVAPAPPVVIPVPVFIPPVSVVPPQLLPPILRPRPRGGTGQPYPGSPSSQTPSSQSPSTASPVPQTPVPDSTPSTVSQYPSAAPSETPAQTQAPTQSQQPSVETTTQVPSQSRSSSNSSGSGSSSSGSGSDSGSSSRSSSEGGLLWPSFTGR